MLREASSCRTSLGFRVGGAVLDCIGTAPLKGNGFSLLGKGVGL